DRRLRTSSGWRASYRSKISSSSSIASDVRWKCRPSWPDGGKKHRHDDGPRERSCASADARSDDFGARGYRRRGLGVAWPAPGDLGSTPRDDDDGNGGTLRRSSEVVLVALEHLLGVRATQYRSGNRAEEAPWREHSSRPSIYPLRSCARALEALSEALARRV